MDEDGSVTAVTPSVRTNRHLAYNGKLILISVLALVAICIILAFFHTYGSWAHQRRSNREFRPDQGPRGPRADYLDLNFESTITSTTTRAPPKGGLERSILNSIPTFLYDTALHDPPVECAVCLSEFGDNELGRVLPSCNHCFHVDCIDMWFYSRSNCPLCRAKVKLIENPVGNVTSAGETSGSDGFGLSNVSQGG